MAKGKPTNNARKARKGAIDDLTNVCIGLSELEHNVMIHEYAIRGMLGAAISLKVPLDEVPGFVEPALGGLSNLHSETHRLAELAVAVARSGR